MIKRYLVLLLSTIHLCAFSQDSHFTQFQNTRGYLNPAVVGTDSTLMVTGAFRLQWPDISGNYTSVHLSADNYSRCLRGGVGINILNDKAGNGSLTINEVLLNYAPHFELFDHKIIIQPGIGISFIQKSVDWSKLTFGDQISTQNGFIYATNEYPGTSKKNFFDLNAGLFVYSKSIYVGFAVNHLTQPDEGFVGTSRLPMKVTFHAGANLGFNTEKFILSPNILYMKQQDFTEFMPGVTAKFVWAILGVSYRNEDAFNIITGLQFKYFKIGYSYDYTISKLTNKTGGSHEIQLSFFIDSKKRFCKIKTIRLI